MKKSSFLIGIGIVALGVILYLTDGGKSLVASVITDPHQEEFVTLETDFGDITIQILHQEAPNIAKNFLLLTKDGRYDRTIFHRVISGFVIQGGDYQNMDGTGGTSYSGELLADEISPSLSHVRGVVSMANRGPNTNGSQFFIVHQDAPFLDGRHSIFGQVVDGMETIDKIAAIKTDTNDRPLREIRLNRAIVEQVK